MKIHWVPGILNGVGIGMGLGWVGGGVRIRPGGGVEVVGGEWGREGLGGGVGGG